MELIEVEKLRDEILYDSDYENDIINHFLDVVDSQSTVDAEPVQHGHIVWKDRFVGGYKYAETKCHNCGTIEKVEVEHPIKTKVGYCSECGKRLDDIFMKYCPNCGAKMDLEECENG